MAVFTDNGIIKPCDCDGGCEKCEYTETVRADQKKWRVELDIGTARRLSKDIEWDIWNQDNLNVLFKAEEIETQINILWVIIEEQAQTRNIDEAEFAKRLGGEADVAAHNALVEAIRDFFQGRGAVELARAVEKQEEMVQKAHRKAETKITEKADGLDAQIDARMNQAINDALEDGQTSGESQESSE